MGANTIAVTDASFEADVLKSGTPVLVDFWAEWCPPCRALGPSLEELAQDKAGTLKVVKINIDDNPEWATKYGVRSIPTLLLVKGGEVVDQKVGGMAKSQLYAWVEQTI